MRIGSIGYRIRPPLVAATLVFVATCHAAADKPQLNLSGTYEHYFYTHPKIRGAQFKLGWYELRGSYGPQWSFVGSGLFLASISKLDEAYIQYDLPNWAFRGGRFRSKFGFTSWDEMYTPFIPMALVTTSQLRKGYALMQQGTGVQATWRNGDLEVHGSVVDTKNLSYEAYPDRPDLAIGHAQYRIGDLMVGASAATSVRGLIRSQNDLFGADFRWTRPHWQIRGEYATSKSGSPKPYGAFVDVFYRPPGFARTQFGLRIEEIRPFSKKAVSRRAGLGVQHIISKNWTAKVNYFFGNDASPGADDRGWSTQLMYTVRF